MAPHLIIFSICVLLVLHTYVLYPIILRLIARFKKPVYDEYQRGEDLPFVTVLLSVHNEEKIIEEKIHSTFNTHYPIDKLRMIIGADDCTDMTISFIEQLQEKYPGIVLQQFDRIGKGNVFNRIMQDMKWRKDEIIICTDANVFFNEDTIFHLIKKMKTPEIGLIGAWVVNENTRSEMAQQEQIYIQSENKIKYNEGKLEGNMIGAFGACYAMKAELYHEIPPNFITDDFFLSLKVLEGGHQCILEIDAICFERVNPSLWSEFKRKKRYAAGNFQNFFYFKPIWFKNIHFAFCFWSHKVLRWFTPFLLIIAFGISLINFHNNAFLKLYLVANFVGIASGIIYPLFSFLKIELKMMKFVTYFMWMNFALTIGLFNYLKGIETNVWKPTERI